jgi:hypothetical protein
MDKVMSSVFSGLMVGICLSESCFVEGDDEEVENEDGKGGIWLCQGWVWTFERE